MTKPEQFIEEARKRIGIPYRYAARTEEIGAFYDCSSYTQEMAKLVGISLDRSTILQAAHAGTEVEINDIQPGDLLFHEGDKGHYNKPLFQGKKVCIGHVTIYTGNGMAIHATGKNGGEGVIEESLEAIVNGPAGPIVMAKRIFSNR